MKKILFAVIFIAGFLSAKTYAAIHPAAIDSTLKTLPDGQYFADVSYFRYPDNISADYSSIKLRVRDGLVHIVYLDNGRVIHDGINSEGYLFTGGKIKVRKDK